MDKHNGVTKEMMTMMIMVKKVPWVLKNMEKSFSPQYFTDMNKTEALP